MNTNKIKFATNLEQLQAGTESVFSIAPKVPAKGSLVIYENSIKFYHPDQKIPHTEPPERIENDIKNFSASSRKRLFDLFNQINYSSYGIPLFLSLTYHYDDPTNRKSLKEMLRSFHKRLNRALPPFHYIWKFEYQLRGTPHYHLILFPLNKNENFSCEKFEKIIKQHWLELKSCKCNHCKNYAAKVVEVKTIGAALTYIAKEIAKLQERYEEHDLGRIWGRSNALRTQPIKTIEIQLNDYEKYINAAIFEIEKKIENNKLLKEETRKKLEQSKLYLLGLKYVPYNSTVYINEKLIRNLIFQQELKNKNLLKPKKLSLKKYNWR